MSPPSLATRARRVLQSLPEPAPRILLACSGGPDSQALLDVMAHVAAHDGRLRLLAAGVDHGLRPAAQDELTLAATLAEARGVPFHRLAVDVCPGPNLHARARDARYRVLEQLADDVGATYLATAHHQDDRAETVLLRLLRGAPLLALGVLPPVDGRRLRPLIHAPRSALEAHVVRRCIPFARDPSNGNPRFLRARIRTEVMPLLRTLDPRVDEHLVALAEDALALASDADLAELRRAVQAQGAQASQAALRALLRARDGAEPGAAVWLSDGRVARWDEARRMDISTECAEARPRRPKSKRKPTGVGSLP